MPSHGGQRKKRYRLPAIMSVPVFVQGHVISTSKSQPSYTNGPYSSANYRQVHRRQCFIHINPAVASSDSRCKPVARNCNLINLGEIDGYAILDVRGTGKCRMASALDSKRTIEKVVNKKRCRNMVCNSWLYTADWKGVFLLV